jgi:hypothetical protein
MRHTAFKRTVMAAVLAVATAVAGQAQALDVANTDLVLALWGNTTEYLVDLGSQSSLFNGTTKVFSIDPTKFSQVTGSNAVNFSIYGITYDTNTFAGQAVSGGIVKPLSALTPTEQASIFPTGLFNNAFNQVANLSGDGLNNQLIAASNPNSFTSLLGTSNTLAGTFPVSTGGALGGLLNILSVSMTQQNAGGTGPLLSQLGTAVLAANGSTLTVNTGVAAIPVPAAVYLFGTGLIGLVGIARRSMRQGTA